MPEISQAYLKERLSYCTETGLLTWKTHPFPRLVGSQAGSIVSSGYLSVRLFKKRRLAHRLIWMMMTGSMPDQQIDHIDGCPSNNRWSNLRLASQSENNQNRKKGGARGTKPSRFIGVDWEIHRKRWRAKITIPGGKRVYLGSFQDEEDAALAYLQAKAVYHPFQPFVRDQGDKNEK